MEGIGIATPRFGAFACPFCEDMDARYDHHASSTTCMTLVCYCGAICPAGCRYSYSGGYGVRIGHAETDFLKPLKLSEVPKWVLEKWAGDEDRLYDDMFASFPFYKILEVIPQELSYYEATSKVPYDKVLELVSRNTESLGLSNIFPPANDGEVFSLSEEQTNELAAHYPTLVQLPNYGDGRFQLQTAARLMYENDPDSDVWYDPFDANFRKKLADAKSSLSKSREKRYLNRYSYYCESEDESDEEPTTSGGDPIIDAYNRESEIMKERAYLRGLVQGKTRTQAAEILRTYKNTSGNNSNYETLKSLGLLRVYDVATGETDEEDENAANAAGRFLRTPVPDYSIIPKAPEFESAESADPIIYKVSRKDTRFKSFNVSLPVNSFDLRTFAKEYWDIRKDIENEETMDNIIHMLCQNTETGETFRVRCNLGSLFY